ncbi:hypothetical protein [Candidatus Propionivibrio aalborgensis]|nr:hypothetical protein [Candidatus Propionivibrio aalborgensis]
MRKFAMGGEVDNNAVLSGLLQQLQTQNKPEPLTQAQTVNADMNNLGKIDPVAGDGRGAQHNWMVQSASDVARQAGVNPNAAYRPGSASDPHAAGIAQPQQQMIGAPEIPRNAPTQNRMTPISEMFGKRRYADGGKVETAEEILARISGKYGVGNKSTPEPAPQPAPQPVQQPATNPGIGHGIVNILKGRKEQIDKASGYANGGKIKGPGTPTSDSIDASVKQTGEPIKVSTDERILSKAQDAELSKIASDLGFPSLDSWLETMTGKPVGPTMKGGIAHAANGADLDMRAINSAIAAERERNLKYINAYKAPDTSQADAYRKLAAEIPKHDATIKTRNINLPKYEGVGYSKPTFSGAKDAVKTVGRTAARVAKPLGIAGAVASSGIQGYDTGSDLYKVWQNDDTDLPTKLAATAQGAGDVAGNVLSLGLLHNPVTGIANIINDGDTAMSRALGNNPQPEASLPAQKRAQAPQAATQAGSAASNGSGKDRAPNGIGSFTQDGKTYDVQPTGQDGIKRVNSKGQSPLFTNIDHGTAAQQLAGMKSGAVQMGSGEKDPGWINDAYGNDMRPTLAMKAQLADMERARYGRDMQADIKDPRVIAAAALNLQRMNQNAASDVAQQQAQQQGISAGLDQQVKRNSLAEYASLQKAIADMEKMPDGPQRDAAMDGIAARQSRSLPDKSQLVHLAGGSDPNDPLGARKLPDRLFSKDRRGMISEVSASKQNETGATIPSAAADMLKKNPSMAEDFDKKYGVGAAKQILGK